MEINVETFSAHTSLPVRKMTGKLLKRRRKVGRQRKRLKRKNMSPTRLALERERGRLRNTTKNMTSDQLQRRRERDRLHKRVKRGSMTQTERQISLERDRIRQRTRRGNMTKAELDTQRERDRIRKRLKRSAKAGIFSFGTKNSDLWGMKLNSWTFDNVDSPWSLPSYANVSDIMEAAFCVVNMKQDFVDDTVWSETNCTTRDPLSLSSDEEEEDVENFDDWENSDYITSDNIGVKVFAVNTGDTNTTTETTGCEIDLITPEVIITTDSET